MRNANNAAKSKQALRRNRKATAIRSWISLCAIVLSVLFCFAGCQLLHAHIGAHSAALTISDYVLRIVSATGDRHNMNIRYSLQHKNGSPIDPETHFESLSSMPRQNAGGHVSYSVSDDGTCIWIDEQWSSASSQKEGQHYTLTLKNLVLGQEQSGDDIQGEWTMAFQADLVDEIIELLHDKINNDTAKQPFQLSSIQLSPVGLHIEMLVPDADIQKMADGFSITIVSRDGRIISLPDRTQSINGAKQRDGCYSASCQLSFPEAMALSNIRDVVICGQAISVNNVY